MRALILTLLVFSLKTSANDLIVKACKSLLEPIPTIEDIQSCVDNSSLVANIGTNLLYRHRTSGNHFEVKIKNKGFESAAIVPSVFDELHFSQGLSYSGDLENTHFVFRPKAEIVKPNGYTIMFRSPYATISLAKIIEDYIFPYLSRGFNVVLQPLRGSYLNSGVHQYYNLEADIEDAKNLINWIIKQKWSNGKVIPAGASYDGYTALAAVASNHSAIPFAISASPIGRNFYTKDIGYYYKGYSVTGRDDTGSALQNKFNVMKSSTPFTIFPLLVNQYLGSVVDEVKVNKKEDKLIKLINETDIPIFFSFGVQDDHTSYATAYLFDHYQGPKYLLDHDMGHSEKPIAHYLDLFLSDKLKTIDGTTTILKEPNTELLFNGKKVEHSRYIGEADINPGRYRGHYEVEIEFEKVTDVHANDVIIRLIQTGGGTLFSNGKSFEILGNAGIFSLETGKSVYKITGNFVDLDVRGRDQIEADIIPYFSSVDKQLIPKVKTLKLKLLKLDSESQPTE